MDCRRVQRVLSDHLDTGSSTEPASAAAHLETCAACRRRFEEFRAQGADLRAWRETLPSPDLERRTLERWHAEQRRPARPQPLSRLVPVPLVGAAVVLVVWLTVARWSPPPRGKSVTASDGVAAPDARPMTSPGQPGAMSKPAPANEFAGSKNVGAALVAAQGDHKGRPYSPRRRTSFVQPAISMAGTETPSVTMPQESSTPPGDDFVLIPPPRLADLNGSQMAAALDEQKREAAVVDARLARKVTLQEKGIALSDLCDRLRADTGLHLTAGRSVADEKVTIFCKEVPLRDVMRQLSRPFGYAWTRTGKTGEYRYELMQDLRSQLMEEELRNRDRNTALLDVDRVMQGYRPYLDLSPEELRARIEKVRPGEAKIPAHFAGTGWGPLQLYSRLSPADIAALRAGEKVSFDVEPDGDRRLLSPELARGVLRSVHDRRIRRQGDRFEAGPVSTLPDGLPPASVPEARAMVTLKLDWSELGEVTLRGSAGFYIGTLPDCLQIMGDDGPLAVGVSPSVRIPDNRTANTARERDPALRPRVTVQPTGQARRGPSLQPPPRSGEGESRRMEPKVTTADVLEALHKATGMNLVADYYTRLYPRSGVTVRDRPLFETLNQIADTMRLRWSLSDGKWLQFRSTGYYHDRLKEVPNRLLDRWAASRRKHGALTLEDLVEIAQLTDSQLDSQVMAEGARELYDLEEWALGRNAWLRSQWRFLAGLTVSQREQAARPVGLPFSQLLLAQQQQFLDLTLGRSGPGRELSLAQLEDLAGASLRVDYRTAGRFQWARPEEPDTPAWRKLLPSPVLEADRESALAAARRIHPQATAADVVPTELAVTFIFSLGGPGARYTPMVLRANSRNTLGAPPRPVSR